MRVATSVLFVAALLVTSPLLAQQVPTPSEQANGSPNALDAALTAAAPALERCAAALPEPLQASLAGLRLALATVPGRALRVTASAAPPGRPGARLVSCVTRALVQAAGRSPRGSARAERAVAPFEGRASSAAPAAPSGNEGLPSDLTAGCQSAADCELVCNVPPACCPGCGCNFPVLRRHMAAVGNACLNHAQSACPSLDCAIEVRAAACVQGHCRAVVSGAAAH